MKNFISAILVFTAVSVFAFSTRAADCGTVSKEFREQMTKNLIEAVEKSAKISLLTELIENCADLNLRVDGKTALEETLGLYNGHYNGGVWAVQAAHLFLNLGAKLDVSTHAVQLAAEHDALRSVLERFLQEGYNVNTITDSKYQTALMHASLLWSLENVKILLKYGADPRLKGKYGNTPLHMAAKRFTPASAPGTIYFSGLPYFTDEEVEVAKETIKVLVQAGADINALNDDSYTPLFYSAMATPNYKMLVALSEIPGINLNFQDGNGHTTLHVAVSLTEYLDRVADNDHHLRAVQEEFVAAIEKLVKAGANPKIRNNYNKAPVDYIYSKFPKDLKKKLKKILPTK